MLFVYTGCKAPQKHNCCSLKIRNWRFCFQRSLTRHKIALVFGVHSFPIHLMVISIRPPTIPGSLCNQGSETSFVPLGIWSAAISVLFCTCYRETHSYLYLKAAAATQVWISPICTIKNKYLKAFGYKLYPQSVSTSILSLSSQKGFWENKNKWKQLLFRDKKRSYLHSWFCHCLAQSLDYTGRWKNPGYCSTAVRMGCWHHIRLCLKGKIRYLSCVGGN